MESAGLAKDLSSERPVFSKQVVVKGSPGHHFEVVQALLRAEGRELD